MADVYYDPYDTAIDSDPYPVWRRLRDEAPLYRNEEHGFWALSRWDDVEPALSDFETYRSGRGTTFDIIKANVDIPPGIILFEDPPIHNTHRALLSRIFTPRRMLSLEPLIRSFCEHALDEHVGAGGFNVITDLGVEMPVRTMGYLFGIPEEDISSLRSHTDDLLSVADGEQRGFEQATFAAAVSVLADYVEWRSHNPSDDLMTQLLEAEVEDESGTKRRLTRDEVLMYATTVAGAGNETATRLVGFTTELLAHHPDQRAELAADHSLIPSAIEEVLRFEPPSPVQCRYVAKDVEHHGQSVPEGSIMVLLNGSANRDDRHFTDAERFDIHRQEGAHLSFGLGLHYCLGAALARLEGRIALEEMLKRWPEWEVSYVGAERAHTSSVRGWASLPITTSKGS